jgi:isoamylase
MVLYFHRHFRAPAVQVLIPGIFERKAPRMHEQHSPQKTEALANAPATSARKGSELPYQARESIPEAKEDKDAVKHGMKAKSLASGKDLVLGATCTENGIHFAIASGSAQEVFLVLFDRADGEATATVKMDRSGDIWHKQMEGLKKGQLYGYRVHGPYDPGQGFRFNPNKLLADPYAKAFTGKFTNPDNLLLGYDPGSESKDLAMDARDNASVVPKCIAWDDAFDWEGDQKPGIAPENLVIYEVHVKGFTAHPSSQVGKPGTYAGFIEKIPYLKELGVNAVELLPVHEFVSEDFLLEKGLSNYWGYNTIGFFAPESSYSTRSYPGCAIDEFKTLVKELHRAGIEVILDVVFNHSAEGNECGPTLSFKGIDNRGYYSLTGEAEAPLRYYRNYSGTGNTLTASSPIFVRLTLDALRYWSETMHVDGFRFDLAACLGRDHTGAFSACGHLLAEISQDPVLGKLKLIAEPWDIEAYAVGGLPQGWSEWNGKFRDCFRKFAKGDPGQIKEAASRIAGSPDLFGHNGRGPSASVNFLTCHDGFTLYDLVAYNGKHNEANLEDNQDGLNENLSWNHGAEGESDDPAINDLRGRQVKNLFCHQMFSLGMPMITAGDEFMRTQRGNNNVYPQDNELSWMDWAHCGRNQGMVAFVKSLLRFRAQHPVLHRSRYFLGEDKSGDGIPDIHWVGPGNGEMLWDDPEQRALAFQVDGNEGNEGNRGGEAKDGQRDYRLFVVFNASADTLPFGLPALPEGRGWHRVIDTLLPSGEDFLEDDRQIPIEASPYHVGGRSCVVLKSKQVPPTAPPANR